MEFEMNTRPRFFFGECCRIPHGSRNEKQLSDYVVEFAKEHGLECKQDEMYNVMVYKKASPGYEDAPAIAIQAHLDMVCEKNKDSDHDFEKDPLKLYVEDGILRAEGTTLGADDCTGVAYMLSILEDDTLEHPALECIFTVQEEIGLFGAIGLKKEDITPRRLISLDGGGETVTMLSSAGGCECFITKDITWVDNSDPTYQVSIRGLAGGHSGGEIHKEKGNANQLAIRAVKEAAIRGVDVSIVYYEGGLKDNAIPREADVIFSSPTPIEEIEASIAQSVKDIKTELEFSDAGFELIFEQVDTATKKADKATSDAIMNYVFLMPNGFQHRSMAIEGLTLTSLNLGIVRTTDTKLEITVSCRSALESGITNLVNILTSLANVLGFELSSGAYYPGWNYKEVSPMRDYYAEVVKELYGQELKMVAGHGGTECGVFAKMYEDMDIISMGPIAAHVHTPDEELNLESFDRTYKLLTETIKRAKQ